MMDTQIVLNWVTYGYFLAGFFVAGVIMGDEINTYRLARRLSLLFLCMVFAVLLWAPILAYVCTKKKAVPNGKA